MANLAAERGRERRAAPGNRACCWLRACRCERPQPARHPRPTSCLPAHRDRQASEQAGGRVGWRASCWKRLLLRLFSACSRLHRTARPAGGLPARKTHSRKLHPWLWRCRQQIARLANIYARIGIRLYTPIKARAAQKHTRNFPWCRRRSMPARSSLIFSHFAKLQTRWFCAVSSPMQINFSWAHTAFCTPLNKHECVYISFVRCFCYTKSFWISWWMADICERNALVQIYII